MFPALQSCELMKMGIPMVTTTYKGVTLSAHAVRNGAPMPVHSAPVIRGDFAAGNAGKARRSHRRAAISAKRSFLLSC
jgi:hypothetical protein